MIPRLAQSSISFGASQAVSPREAYETQMLKNSQTAQKQTNMVVTLMNQIPMQGTGQKLDVIA